MLAAPEAQKTGKISAGARRRAQARRPARPASACLRRRSAPSARRRLRRPSRSAPRARAVAAAAMLRRDRASVPCRCRRPRRCSAFMATRSTTPRKLLLLAERQLDRHDVPAEVSCSESSGAGRLARSRSSRLTTTSRGSCARRPRAHTFSVCTSTPATASTTTAPRRRRAARRRASLRKLPKPGVSMRLIFVSCSTRPGRLADERVLAGDRFLVEVGGRRAVVDPPEPVAAPAVNSSAETSWVLPEPLWPTKATLRIVGSVDNLHSRRPSGPRVGSSQLSAVSFQPVTRQLRLVARPLSIRSTSLARPARSSVLRLGQQGEITSEKQMILKFAGRPQSEADEQIAAAHSSGTPVVVEQLPGGHPPRGGTAAEAIPRGAYGPCEPRTADERRRPVRPDGRCEHHPVAPLAGRHSGRRSLGHRVEKPALRMMGGDPRWVPNPARSSRCARVLPCRGSRESQVAPTERRPARAIPPRRRCRGQPGPESPSERADAPRSRTSIEAIRGGGFGPVIRVVCDHRRRIGAPGGCREHHPVAAAGTISV